MGKRIGTMNKKELEAFAREAAKGIKTEQDLNDFSLMMTKVTVEAALNAELEDHLGYEKHQSSSGGNSCNGFSSKQIKTEDGQFDLELPRDRDSSFEPKLVKKHQSRFTSMDDKILSLYAKGMTTREIVATFKEMYDADISATLISRVTGAVIEQVAEWQSRPLDAVYPIVYLDCIVVKIRQDKHVINKAIYLALGVNMGSPDSRSALLLFSIFNSPEINKFPFEDRARLISLLGISRITANTLLTPGRVKIPISLETVSRGLNVDIQIVKHKISTSISVSPINLCNHNRLLSA